VEYDVILHWGKGGGANREWVASIQIKMKVRAIMILTKTYDKVLIGYTRRLVEWLMDGERGSKHTVFVLLKLLVDCWHGY